MPFKKNRIFLLIFLIVFGFRLFEVFQILFYPYTVTFSEDIDLWVRPDADNCEAFLAVLRSVGAVYYKLTPPFTEELLCRGHGFHFVLPEPAGEGVFLDVMGCPPRAGDFAAATAESRIIPTEWGDIPTVGIHDLVALKTTQRLGDYPVIGRLVLCRLRERSSLLPAEREWALANIYTVEDLEQAVLLHPSLLQSADREVRELAQQQSAGQVDDTLRDTVEEQLLQKMQRARRADRAYWRGIIDELRDLRTRGQLVPAGTPV